MGRKDRETLIDYFKKGNIPTEDHFKDLIESSPNFVDDDCNNNSNSVTLFPFVQSSELGDIEEEAVAGWYTYLEQCHDRLQIKHHDQPVLNISKTGIGEINKEASVYELDFKGIIKAEKIVTAHISGTVAADRKWHPLVEDITENKLFKIVAAIGSEDNGDLALIHAYASICRGGRKISCCQKKSFWWGDKIKLKWQKRDGAFDLMIRSYRSFAKDIVVSYRACNVWEGN